MSGPLCASSLELNSTQGPDPKIAGSPSPAALILDIQRFDSPANCVAYFGVLPAQLVSGVERDGLARGAGRYLMMCTGLPVRCARPTPP
ncbi:hypothetical protein BH10PLA2_BH10PLA2_16330 [soil metagenome]